MSACPKVSPVDWFAQTAIGVIVGGAITWYVARLYYVKASRDLTAESDRLRNLVIILARALESEGIIELHRNERGEITGLVHRLSASAVGTSDASATLTVAADVTTQYEP